MAQDLWSLKEDGYLNVDLDSQNIVYHPTLNIILVTTRSGYVHVLDVNSGVVLQTSTLSAKPSANIKCSYLEEQNKVLFLDGQGVGVRSDYNGVLLLDTILQRRLKSSDEIVKLELLLSEAIILQQSLKSIDLASTDLHSEVLTELTDKITRAQSQPKSGIKAQKWNTICLELKLCTLRAVALRVVTELKRLNRHVPALAVAAAISERLTELAPRERTTPCDRASMYSEAKRRETFARWPHMDYKWALPEQMAQAGFYHQPNSSGDDRAMCFTCAVCLVCWERTDEPWSEHERHSPSCPFVKGEYTQNVPLSVTYATSPALDIAPRGHGGTTLVSNSNVGDLMALGHSGGMVSVYNVAAKLKRTHCFYVTHADYTIPDLSHNVLKRENNVALTALSIVGEKKRTSTPQPHKTPTKANNVTTQPTTQIRPSIICGITVCANNGAVNYSKSPNAVVESPSVQALNDHNQQKNALSTNNLKIEPYSENSAVRKYSYLVVYDFQYKSAACNNINENEDIETGLIGETSDVFIKKCSDILLTKLFATDAEQILDDQMDAAAKHLGSAEVEPPEPLEVCSDLTPNSYQNFIPPQNDKIFFPPGMQPTHNGPRLCTEENIFDSSYLMPDKDMDYSFTNGQLDDSDRTEEYNEPSTSSEKSISDHISDIKLKGEQKTISYSHAVQCVMLPESCQHKNLEIFEIIPTRDGQHILIVLRSKDMNILGKSMLLVYALNFSSRVVKIDEKPILTKELSASEQPEEVSLLPVLEGAEYAGSLEGLAALVCADGAVRLVDLSTLNIVSEAKIEGSRYVSATYCNSLERLCVCTERGPLHFYAVLGRDGDFNEERDEEDFSVLETSSGSPMRPDSGGSHGVTHFIPTSPIDPSLAQAFHTEKVNDEALLIAASAAGDIPNFSEMLNCRTTLTVAELRLLHLFCQCEPLSASYCAVLPACWSEMQQCQRKLPQHLQVTGDGSTQHTRTWRLQTDATTWDEHVLELTLPWSACVGHVDFRFTLHAPGPALPNLQVTLLKQHASGIGHRKFGSHSTSVDDTVHFSLFEGGTRQPNSGTSNSSGSTGSIQNPVVTDEYLRAYNADILSGPVNLGACLDLSEHGGCVTLTSPKLLKARGRTLLVHIKALLDPSKDMANTKKDDKIGSVAKKSRYVDTPCLGFGATGGTSSASGGGGITGSPSTYERITGRKAEYYMGCDWLHEISITIRTMKQVNLPNERLQRAAVLESNHLLDILCECACRSGKDRSRLVQTLALDILTWISNVRLGRRGSELGSNLLRTIEPHLYSLILAGLIEGTRSIAHKLVKLLIVCVENGRTMMNVQTSQQFDNAVLQALLRATSTLGRVQSASALRWFTMLLQHVTVTAPNGPFGAATECLALVRRAAQHLHARTNPYHQLLRSRFGLYATPFEPELLDVDPPALHKSSSVPVTFASVVSGDPFPAGPSINGNILPINVCPGAENFDLKELFSIPGISTQNTNVDNKAVGMTRCRGLVANNHTRGLLETEPLHYTCVSASDGTRMERFDANTSGGTTIANGNSHAYAVAVANLISPAANYSPMYSGPTAHQSTTAVQLSSLKKFQADPMLNDGINSATYHTQPSSATMQLSSLKKFQADVFLNANLHAVTYNTLYDEIKKEASLLESGAEGGPSSAIAETTNCLSNLSNLFPRVEKLIDEQMLLSGNDTTVIDVIDLDMDSNMTDPCGPQFIMEQNPWMHENANMGTPVGTVHDISNVHELTNVPDLTNVHHLAGLHKLASAHEAKKKHEMLPKKPDSNTLPWQQLLLSPPQQVLVIERMHSGARRFVVLDFGAPVLLTDLLIPACSDLVSLSVDVWWQGEDTDVMRIAIAPDIDTKCLVLSDLQPPPLCRFMKITTIGRYGMSTTRCKIPVGNFYGHVVVLPEDTYADSNAENIVPTKTQVETQLNVLAALLEDINCRYSLSCSKLRDILDPLLTNDTPNAHHMNNYLKNVKDDKGQTAENTKIFNAYNECVTYQHQLNIVRNVMKRLESHINREETVVYESEVRCLAQASTHKLLNICENFLDILLSIVYEIGAMPRTSASLFKQFNQSTCEELFMSLCVSHDTRVQLSTASLLVRMCGLQSWWGTFLADTITRLYASHNQTIFPQDRVFIILTYLCRKSLSNGATRSSILDPTLRSLCVLLKPLVNSQGLLVAAKTDLGLLSWLLLFLSLSLDSTKFESEECTDAISSRWDWLIAEATVNRMSVNQARTADGYRKKLHKRFLHYKQQLDHLDYTQKAVQASTQALSALSNHAANLSSKLEAALKQQEHFFKKMKQFSSKQIEDIKTKRYEQFLEVKSKRSSNGSSRSGESTTNFDATTRTLNHAHCLVVCRGLIILILNLDCTCNIDIFLLSCKTVARLIMAAKPVLSLQQLVTSQQLVQLLRLAVRNEGNQWVSHAVMCLLQDMLEGHRLASRFSPELNSDEIPFDSNSEMDTETSQNASTWLNFSENVGSSDIMDMDDMMQMTMDQDVESQLTNISNATSKSNGAPLPSLPESDDSDLEEVLDVILERGKCLLRKTGTAKAGILPTSSISTAIDARLEIGLDSMPEIMLRRLTMLSSYHLPLAVNGSLAVPPENARAGISETWPDDLITPWLALVPPTDMANVVILTQCFDSLFSDLEFTMTITTLEQTLQLWITMSINLAENTGNNSNTFNPSTIPGLSISPTAISHLISALTWLPSVSLRAWTLTFQCLTLASNLPFPDWNGTDLEQSLNGMAGYIVKDIRFAQVLFRFFSGYGVTLSDKRCAGPSVCQAFHDLLVRLQMRTDVVTTTSQLGNFFKDMLMKILHQSIQVGSGPIATQQGPLDVHCKFVQLLLNFNFKHVDVISALNILDSLGLLVYSYMSRVESVKCVSLAEQGSSQGNSFGSLFSSVLGTDAGKHGKPASYDNLIISLLKLATKLVQTPISTNRPKPAPDVNDMDTATSSTSVPSDSENTSQTDESKAEQRGRVASASSNTLPVKVVCIADPLLQHIPTILRLCHTLSACGGSSLAMLMGAMPHHSISEIGEPATIGDAVFQLLASISNKCTKIELLITPVLEFLSARHEGTFIRGTTAQLSEPLVWWLLQVLGTEAALSEFNAHGGVRLIAEHLVRCYKRAISTLQPATISQVMQHLSSSHGAHAASLAYQGGAPNSKKMQQANLEHSESLINFAPLGVITSTSATAQPANVLVQATLAPHRRARTPQWSYHFYADENHVELCIALPAAILLREVQLQPHLNSLATCPSAIALEVSRNGSAGLVPVGPPLQTSGMSFIRLHLPTPEVVTNVLIRLYKPRDSTNIGLLQIRLLGTAAFGGTKNQQTDLCEEEQLTKSSLGWLRLLHQCFNLPTLESDLSVAVVQEAAQVEQLLESCCGLLLVPVQVPPLFIPNLERILLKLSLHDPNLSFSALQMLLDNSAAFLQSTKVPSLRAVESVCELLFKLCAAQDQNTHRRTAAVLTWLCGSAERALRFPNQMAPNASYIHCIASILWSAHHSNTSVDVRTLITKDLFELVYKWSTIAADSLALKRALDAMLCSLCVVNDALFPLLLFRMSVLVPNLSTDREASVTDDQKDSEYMTDDTKENLGILDTEFNWHSQLVLREMSSLTLTGSQLRTIATASQSPVAALQLLDSGLLKLLTQIVLHFCNVCADILKSADSSDRKLDDVVEETCKEFPMIRIEHIVNILNFFADLCVEANIREWLGSFDGSGFWIPLLRLLCYDRSASLNRSQLRSGNYYKLEDATVRFLSRCCSLCSNNQKLLASCLCDVIEHQKVNTTPGMCGFTRRLILQLLLENEKVWVFIKADETIYKSANAVSTFDFSPHPAFRVTNHHILLHLNINTTLGDILEHHVSFTDSSFLSPDNQKDNAILTSTVKDLKKDLWEVALDMTDQMSVAAGVTAKDKRVKDAKNLLWQSSTPSTPNVAKRKILIAQGAGISVDGVVTDKNTRLLKCDQLPHAVLAPTIKLSQLLAQINTQVLQLTVVHDKDISNNMTDTELSNDTGKLATTLQVFSSMGGLAILAQHLPLVYAENIRSNSVSAPTGPNGNNTLDAPDADWVKVEGSDDIYEDLDECVPGGSTTPTRISQTTPNVPPHSLAAFALFLRLPGYAEMLLRDYTKALCLLRMVLGVTDDGEGGDIFALPIAHALPTLPFQVLRRLYDSTPVTTDDSQLLRRTSIDYGVIHLLLGCLSVFTHQSQDFRLPGRTPHEVISSTTTTTKSTGNSNTSSSAVKTDDKTHLYWAKGTGFGTGSTQQSWNVEQALLRQRSEEEHVTVLLQVLSSYINPGVNVTEFLMDIDYSEEMFDSPEEQLPPAFYDLLLQSCLLPALCSYLRNDSVLDMARHIPLYRALLQLLRSVAMRPQLVTLLLPQISPTASGGSPSTLSIVSLLTNMKLCVDTYASRLKINKKSTAGSTAPKPTKYNKFYPSTTSAPEDLESDEGLALLIPDIQATAELVRTAAAVRGTRSDEAMDHSSGSAQRDPSANVIEKPLKQSLEQKYLEVMKQLQFDTYEMIKECSESEGGGYKFVVSYHFEGNVKAAGDRSHPARVKRLAQEAVTLATSLPLSYSSSVFVRCDTDRLDVMKVLITGPADTPYANGCFELDVYFPPDYPQAPMMINLETTGRHTVRFNPNLYNDGKVCLSVLNTWHGRPEEKWNAQTSSFLQVLVSIQSLILVPEPYFNEPGYERSRGTPSGTQSSLEYNANICQATVRWAMLEQIRNPCPCFKQVIHTHFWLKRHEIAEQVERWIAELETQSPEKRSSGRTATKRVPAVSALALKHHYLQLHEELTRLKTPEGLEDLEQISSMEGLNSATATVAATSTPIGETFPSLVFPVAEAASATSGTSADVHHDIDTDIEMEKMVSKVCE